TITRTSVPNNLSQVPTGSGLFCAQLRCHSTPPGGSLLIPIMMKRIIALAGLFVAVLSKEAFHG
ncbi:hypothetical protein AMECASPLE_036115, partial [Ameca splendens]